MNKGEAQTKSGKRRAQVKELTRQTRELTSAEKKKIKGGVIRSVGNRDGGGPSSAAQPLDPTGQSN